MIQDLQEKKNKNAYTDIDARVLLVSEPKLLYKWKHGKVPTAVLNKPLLLTDWFTSKDTVEEVEEDAWTMEEDAELNRLSLETIELHEEELGRKSKKVIDQTLSVPPKMTEIQVRQLKDELKIVPPSSV